MTAQLRLSQKTIIVTGASSGLGAEVAYAAAAEGASIVLIGRNVTALEQVHDRIEDAGYPQPAIYPLDIAGANSDDFATLAETVCSELGAIDGLVHCAAELGQTTPIELADAGQWVKTLATNLTGPMLLTQACLRALKAAKGTLIYTLDKRNQAYWGAYGVSKMGLAALCDIVAEEMQGDNPAQPHVWVRGIAPGPMRTRLRTNAYPGESAADNPEPNLCTGAFIDALCRRD